MEEFSILEYWAVFKRYRKIFSLIAALIFGVSIVVALNWSNYRSTATVEIEQSEIASNVTLPAGMNTGDMIEALADLRISRIQQKITSTGALVEIITKFNLYPADRARMPIAAIAEQMRGKVRIDLISSALANPASAQKASAGQLSAIAFNLSFEYSDPLLAQQVTNELVTRFLDEDLKQRRATTEETSEFLNKQIEELEKSLADQEKKIAEYRQQSGDTRPEALMFNQQAAAQTSLSLQNVESQIASTQGSISALRAQLAAVDPYSRAFDDGQILTSPSMQLKALQTKYATLTAQYGPEHPDVLKTKRQIESLEGSGGRSLDSASLQKQIDDVDARLGKALKAYGSENPEVISLKRQLESLRKQKKTQGSSAVSAGLIKNDADNPAYLSIVAQLREAEGRYDGLLAQKESLLAEQEKYRQAVLGNPEAIQQLSSLSRDYENAQIRYRDLKAKKMAADMREQMEKDRKGQRLSVINPPELPNNTKPSRLYILIVGFVLGIAGGLGGVIGLQLLSQSVYGPRHLTSLIGTPPLACIPHLSTQLERYRSDRQRRYAIGLGGLFLLIGVIVFSQKVMPLDVLWAMIARRLGLS